MQATFKVAPNRLYPFDISFVKNNAAEDHTGFQENWVKTTYISMCRMWRNDQYHFFPIRPNYLQIATASGTRINLLSSIKLTNETNDYGTSYLFKLWNRTLFISHFDYSYQNNLSVYIYGLNALIFKIK